MARERGHCLLLTVQGVIDTLMVHALNDLLMFRRERGGLRLCLWLRCLLLCGYGRCLTRVGIRRLRLCLRIEETRTQRAGIWSRPHFVAFDVGFARPRLLRLLSGSRARPLREAGRLHAAGSPTPTRPRADIRRGVGVPAIGTVQVPHPHDGLADLQGRR